MGQVSHWGIIIAAVGFLIAYPAWTFFVLYRMSKYVKQRYPIRYAHQLDDAKGPFSKYPFPFNMKWFGGMFVFVSRQSQKIIVIAEQENDQALLTSARNFKFRLSLAGYILLLVIIVTAVAVYKK